MLMPAPPPPADPAPAPARPSRQWLWALIPGVVLVLLALLVAIPALLRTRIDEGGAENPAVAMLRSLLDAEESWKANDLDGNGTQDY